MDLKKFIIFNIFLIFVGVVFAGVPLNTEDGLHHYYKSYNLCHLTKNTDSCGAYPNFFHFLVSLSPFNFQLTIFFLFVYLPFFAFNYLFKSDFAGYFYITMSNFIFFIFHYGVYPSALAVLLLMFFIFINNLRLRIILLFLAPLIHNSAFVLFLLTFAILELFKSSNILKNLILFPIVQVDKSIIFKEFWGKIDYFINCNLFIFSLMGFYMFVKLRRFDLITLIMVSFVASLFMSRAFFPGQLLLVIGFIFMFEKQPYYLKTFFVLLSFVWFSLNVLKWVL